MVLIADLTVVDDFWKSFDLVMLKFEHHLELLVMNNFIIIYFDHKLFLALSDYVIEAMVQPLIWARYNIIIVSNSFSFIDSAVASTTYGIKQGIATLSPIQLNVDFIVFEIKTTLRLHVDALS